ncbi:hypothetical protein [Bradyrhizobium erythrophlei]|nr:hypothetical protein [Bradyrhizobium erythrophlei]
MQSTTVSIILALAIATAALAGSQEERRRLTPSDIAAMARSGAGAGTSGVSGIQTTVLSGEPIDPSPTIDQAVNGGFPWLEIQCARCKTPSDVDLAVMKHPPTTFVHDLAGRLRCRKCAKAGRRPSATLLQLAQRPRHLPSEN